LSVDQRYLGVLTQEERTKLTKALWVWADKLPNQPLIAFLGIQGNLTPREVVLEVEKATENGKAVLEMLEHAVRLQGIAPVIERLIRTEQTERPAQVRY
jgi:hypothetical protein